MIDDLDRAKIKEAQARDIQEAKAKGAYFPMQPRGQAVKAGDEPTPFARVIKVTPHTERHDHTKGGGPKFIRTTFGEG